ncbi:protein of unknown function DUF262 (plasmid) [Crinalium epipsammum PCC 9333]|uniref:GmrSD restriction endonucleases N-terminal domain-containing protein n=1 Tax=Crinalium epipsammum PCC 9333 TaxID=1173022 RepID=K9W6B4_9CYAN|nr:DUF262 domain-containing protein [Crinalium epipsammum]AFZ15716.1 protein of unknown function DUF262 [Crinalium epipsammum PCC 9333]
MNDNVESIPQENEKIEGLEELESVGWGEYPLDSVFVRTEQRTLGEVVKRIKNNRYILNPDFQRGFVWSPKQQSRLIESCLMRIPLPVFYVAEADDGRIIIVDGLQRLTTFYEYLNNDFALNKLGHGGEKTDQEIYLTGKYFRDLPIHLQERVEDTQLTLYIIDSKAPQRAKLDIFERVNSGEPLARQQMRNCLFNGSATRWLAKAAESQAFLKATGNSLSKKTMRDREAINRFCAFRLLDIEQYKSDMDDFLAKSLEKMNTFSENKLEDLTQEFQNSMEVNYLLFGKHSFRKSLAYEPEPENRQVLNIALFDCCSVLLANLNYGIVTERKKLLKEVVKDLVRNEDFLQAITVSTNSSKQVKSRFQMMEVVIKKVFC